MRSNTEDSAAPHSLPWHLPEMDVEGLASTPLQLKHDVKEFALISYLRLLGSCLSCECAVVVFEELVSKETVLEANHNQIIEESLLIEHFRKKTKGEIYYLNSCDEKDFSAQLKQIVLQHE